MTASVIISQNLYKIRGFRLTRTLPQIYLRFLISILLVFGGFPRKAKKVNEKVRRTFSP